MLIGARGPAQAQSAAPAVPAAYAPALEGALVSTYPDGRTGKLWLSADGSFIGESRKKARNAGKWALDHQRLCLRQSRPIPYPFKFCQPLPDSLDTPWGAKAPSGEAVTVKLVAGDRP